MYKVFIKRIPQDIQTSDFETMLQKLNIQYENVDIQISKSKKYDNEYQSHNNFGCTILNFSSEEEAQRCITKINNITISISNNGKKIQLSASPYVQNFKKQIDNSNQQIYVTNLPTELTEDDLHNLFQECGEVLSTKITKKNKHSQNHIGYVLYKNPHDAIKAINTINGKYLGNNIIYVQPYKSTQQRIIENKDVLIQNLPQNANKSYLINLLTKMLNKTAKEIFSGTISLSIPNVNKPHDQLNSQAIFTCVSKEVAEEVIIAINQNGGDLKAMYKQSYNMRQKMRYQNIMFQQKQSQKQYQEPVVETEENREHNHHRRKKQKYNRFK